MRYFTLFQSPSDSSSVFYMELYKQRSLNITILTNDMLTQRRNNQLDNFISQHAANTTRMVSPRKMPSYYPSQFHDGERTVSPNRIFNTRKPMISPARPNPNNNQQRPKLAGKGEQCCANENHRGKRAEYIIHIEDEDMYYCGICATQAASQGFTVNRITVSKKQKVVPHCPSYAANPRYQQLTTLMRDIVKLETEYKRKSPRALEQHYQRQEGLLADFYDSLIAKVADMRDQHLQEFRQEQALSVAAGQMHFSNLEMHMEDLNEAWEDIEETFQEVLEKIDAESFEDGMRTYRNTLNVFRHKLEEFQEMIQPSSFDQNALASRLKQAEDYLVTLWKQETTPQQRQSDRPGRISAGTGAAGRPSQGGTNLKNVHQGLPRSPSQPSQAPAAFRNLFPQDESQEGLPEASPQFKAF